MTGKSTIPGAPPTSDEKDTGDFADSGGYKDLADEEMTDRCLIEDESDGTDVEDGDCISNVGKIDETPDEEIDGSATENETSQAGGD